MRRIAAAITSKIHGGLADVFDNGISGTLTGNPVFNRLLKEQLGNPALLMSDQERTALLLQTLHKATRDPKPDIPKPARPAVVPAQTDRSFWQRRKGGQLTGAALASGGPSHEPL